MVSSSLAEDTLAPDSAQGPTTDAGIEAIKKSVRDLYSQQQKPVAPAVPASAPPPPTAQYMPPSLARSEDDTVIKNNVSKLMAETLPGAPKPGQMRIATPVPPAFPSAPMLPPSAETQATIATPAIDALPATPEAVIPATTPVLVSTAPSAPPAAPEIKAEVKEAVVEPTPPAQAQDLKQIGTPALTPEEVRQSIAASAPAQQTPPPPAAVAVVTPPPAPVIAAVPTPVPQPVPASAPLQAAPAAAVAAIAPTPVPVAPPTPTPAPAPQQVAALENTKVPVADVASPPPSAGGKKSKTKTPAAAPAPAPAPLAEDVYNTPSASNALVAVDESPSDQKDAAFLRVLAGADGVALNVADVAAPADIQAPMHMDEAVAFALKNNFEVLAANEKTNGAYWDKMGAYSQYAPSVQVAADTGPERSDPASINDANGNRVLDNTHNRRDHSISIRQPLIDLGIISDILSGTDKEDLATNDQRDVREGIAYDTVSTYLGLLQSRIAIRLADDYKNYLDNLSNLMRERVAGGGASNADLDRIRGRALTADSARIEALGQYQTDLAEFKRLTKVMPAQLVIPEVLSPAVPPTMQEAMEKALKSNPSYLSSLKKIDIAEDDRNKSFSGLMPKLSGQYTNSYSFNAGGAAEGNPVDGVYPVQKTQQVMLVAEWDLNGGTAITGGLSGIAKEREMDLRAMDVRSRLEQGVQSSYTAINAAHQRQAALEKTVEANERVVKGFDEQFKNGTRSLFDLLDAYEQLYNARLNLMRVTVANAKASYQVRREMGELVPSIIGSETR